MSELRSQEPDDLAGDLRGGGNDRLIMRVGRLQSDFAERITIEGLHGSFIIEEGDHDVAVLSGPLRSDNHKIAIEYTGPRHTISLDS